MVVLLVLGLWPVACDEPLPDRRSPAAPQSAPRPRAVPATSAPDLRDLPTGDRAVPSDQADRLVRAGETKVELLSAGEPPRRLLRYDATQPEQGRLVVTAEIAMAVQQEGEPAVEPPVPRLRVTVDVRVSGAAGQAATVSLTLREAAVAPADQAQPPAVADLEPVLAALTGLESQFPLPPRGLGVGPLQQSRRTAPAVLQLWTTVAEALRDLVTPYPEVEVGVGARWRAFDRVTRGGIEMLRRTTYRVAALDAGAVTLAGEIREVAVASTGRFDPALPPDHVIAVRRGDGTGSRAVVRPLGRLLPTDSESKLMGQVTLDTRPAPAIAPTAVSRRSSVRLEQRLRVAPPRGTSPQKAARR